MSSSKFGKILGPRVVSRVANQFMHTTRILGSYLSLGTQLCIQQTESWQNMSNLNGSDLLKYKAMFAKAGKQNVLLKKCISIPCISCQFYLTYIHAGFLLESLLETMKIVYQQDVFQGSGTLITRDSGFTKGPNQPNTHQLESDSFGSSRSSKQNPGLIGG